MSIDIDYYREINNSKQKIEYLQRCISVNVKNRIAEMEEFNIDISEIEKSYFELEELNRIIERLQYLIKNKKAALNELVERKVEYLSQDVGFTLFQYLIYWGYPLIGANSIKNGKNLSLTTIGTGTCSKCGKEIDRIELEFNSRSSLSIKDNIYCYACNIEIENNREIFLEKINKIREEKTKRLQELRSMPYQDYLQTPEWQDTRKRALKRANFSCQLCNSNNQQLDVHHRTYENLGEEDNRDLIVLCRDCHSKFHNKINGQKDE